MSMLEMIVKNIKYHEDELAKLRVARDVVARLQDVPARVQKAAEVAADKVGGKPMFVVTRNKSKTRVSREPVRLGIISLLDKTKGLNAADICSRMGATEPDQKSVVWGLLSKMVITGDVLRTADKLYLLPEHTPLIQPQMEGQGISNG